MRFGALILPEHPWAEAGPLWRRAEELGFEHAWTYDHLTWRSFRDRPWYAAVPTLTAAALVTGRMRLGTLVASPNFRHPLTFAKEIVSIDDISGGRAIVGVGAGGTGWDATMLGQSPWSPEERAGRFAEFVELTDLVLRAPEVTWRGRYYAVDEARTHPGCLQRPRAPMVIAATGRRSARVAARFGECWVTAGPQSSGPSSSPRPVEEGLAVVEAQMRLVDEACSEIGRDPASLSRMVLTGLGLDPGLSSRRRFEDTAGRYEEAGITDYIVHWPRPQEPFAADAALFETIFSG